MVIQEIKELKYFCWIFKSFKIPDKEFKPWRSFWLETESYLDRYQVSKMSQENLLSQILNWKKCKKNPTCENNKEGRSRKVEK